MKHALSEFILSLTFSPENRTQKVSFMQPRRRGNNFNDGKEKVFQPLWFFCAKFTLKEIQIFTKFKIVERCNEFFFKFKIV